MCEPGVVGEVATEAGPLVACRTADKNKHVKNVSFTVEHRAE
jgi:hypothetical protein